MNKRFSELLRNGCSDIKYYMQYNKGKGSAGTQPIIAPNAPVEEASVKLSEDDEKKKLSGGKSTLKIPLSTSSDVGLKV